MKVESVYFRCLVKEIGVGDHLGILLLQKYAEGLDNAARHATHARLT